MPDAAAPPYPRELERAIVLRDGARLTIRPIRPDDAPRLVALYGRLSRHTAYQRFFTVMQRLPPDWARFLANVDYRRRLALVAEQEPGELVAVARYEPTDRPDTAEIAVVVEDAWQNRALGTALLGHLLEAAEARGVHRFSAYVLANNRRMLDLILRFTDVLERVPRLSRRLVRPSADPERRPPRTVLNCPSIAASLTGCHRATTRAARSPHRGWSSAAGAPTSSAVASARRWNAFPGSRSSSSA